MQLYATQLEKIKKELFPKVDVNIKKAQKKQKELYDERCTPEKKSDRGSCACEKHAEFKQGGR